MKDIIKNIYNNVFFRIFLFLLLLWIAFLLILILILLIVISQSFNSEYWFLITILFTIFLAFISKITKFYNLVIKSAPISLIIFIILSVLYNMGVGVEKFQLFEIVNFICMPAIPLIWIFDFIGKKMQKNFTKQIVIFLCLCICGFIFLPLGTFHGNLSYFECFLFYAFFLIGKNIMFILSINLFQIKIFENNFQKKSFILYFVLEAIIYFVYMFCHCNEFKNYGSENEDIILVASILFPILCVLYLVIRTTFEIIERKQKELTSGE